MPILVGSISADKEAKYGQIFAKYLADPTNLFIISSGKSIILFFILNILYFPV